MEWEDMTADDLPSVRLQAAEHELQRLRQWLRNLDRCPHGRHPGDVCSGWTGPGLYDGGCRDGYSLGNPMLDTQVGTVLGGHPLRVRDLLAEASR